MIPDHYATLGVAPHSDRATIRAAYVKLMRRYHPDRNPSPLAAAQARAITAAYAELSVADRRARYDLQRPLARAARRPSSTMRRPPARFAQYLPMLVGMATAVWLVSILIPPLSIAPEQAENPPLVSGREAVTSRNLIPAAEGARRNAPCPSSAAADQIKRELFRRAARLRGRDHAAFERLAAGSFLRVMSPPLASPTSEALMCNVAIILHLPPGVEARGGRQRLSGQVGYPRQTDRGEAASGISTISDGLVELLATVARTPRDVTDTIAAAPAPAPPMPRERLALPAPPGPAATTAPALPARATRHLPASQQNPSFSCRSARSWAATQVCSSAGLAALDRGLALLYGDSMARAEASKQRALIESDRRFLARRDACKSESCVRSAYLTRIQTIHGMMANRQAVR